MDDSLQILLADDDPTIQLLLRAQIESWGYEIISVNDGRSALDILTGEHPPPIALLDWMMPECDGIDVCQAIKHNDALPFVYTILLTSKSEKKDIVAGLDSGADDYLIKPVSPEELRSRINVAARSVRYERRLKEYAREMERLARERAEQLVHADRLVTLGTLAAGIIHEINNPVSYVSANAQMLERYWSTLAPIIESAAETGDLDQSKKLKMIAEDMPRLASSMYDGAMRINTIVQNLKRFTRKELVESKEYVDLNGCVEGALSICQSRIKHTVSIEKELSTTAVIILGRSQQIEQVLINLIVNASEAMDKQQDQRIRIKISCRDEMAVLVVENNGPAIPEESLKTIWKSFYTTKKEGTGLGLPISLNIIQEHEGSMKCENLPDQKGVRFTIHLPLASTHEHTGPANETDSD